MFLDDYFLRICLTLYYINLKEIFKTVFFFFLLSGGARLFRFSIFSRFFPGRTHPQFCGCQQWFWGSKNLIKSIVEMWGRMVVLFVGGVVIFLWGVVEIGENSPIKRPKNTKFRLKIGVERVPPATSVGLLVSVYAKA